MASNYDEDLTQSPFFLSLKSSFSEILQEAIQDGWLVCVPRSATLAQYSSNGGAFDQHFLMRHILVPSDELPETHFRALDDRDVRIAGSFITVSDVTTHILFTETCYDDHMRKFRLLCLENPLPDPVYDAEIRVGVEPDGPDVGEDVLRADDVDCSDFLQQNVNGRDMLKKIRREAADISANFLQDSVPLEVLQRSLMLAYSECLNYAARSNPYIRVSIGQTARQNISLRKD